MAKLFSVASWNVEHFKDDPTRIARVVEFLKRQQPDVFGLYEVEGKTIYKELVAQMPGYAFQITEGNQTQEILVGAKPSLSPFITQKTEFRSGTTHMRPGQLVSVTKGDQAYALLFLHLASGNDPRGMGLRDDMLERAIEFRRTLDMGAGGKDQAHYLFLGDLNTMGMKYPYQRQIEVEFELKHLDARAKKFGMRRLAKTHPHSWSNGSGSSIKPSALDHVFATQNIRLKNFKAIDGGDAEVSVRGWPTEATTGEQDAWIANYSDHALLYFEVHS